MYEVDTHIQDGIGDAVEAILAGQPLSVEQVEWLQVLTPEQILIHVDNYKYLHVAWNTSVGGVASMRWAGLSEPMQLATLIGTKISPGYATAYVLIYHDAIIVVNLELDEVALVQEYQRQTGSSRTAIVCL